MGYLKNMTGKQKAEYIWEYYKIHIIVGLVLVIGIGYTVYSQYTKINYVFNLTYLGDFMDENKKVALENKLTELTVKGGSKKDRAFIDVMPMYNGNDNSAYIQKLMAEIAVGEIDLIVLSRSQFDNYQKDSAFLRLDDIKALGLESSKYNKALIKSGKYVYGIDLSANTLARSMGMDVKDKAIGVMASTKNRDKAVEVLKWLLQ